MRAPSTRATVTTNCSPSSSINLQLETSKRTRGWTSKTLTTPTSGRKERGPWITGITKSPCSTSSTQKGQRSQSHHYRIHLICRLNKKGRPSPLLGLKKSRSLSLKNMIPRSSCPSSRRQSRGTPTLLILHSTRNNKPLCAILIKAGTILRT